MKLLAIDTATDACSVALAVDGQARCLHTQVPRVHAQRVLAMLDELLAQAGLVPSALDGIVVGVGPGSFTGVRIGCGVAQGLALATDVPVLPVSSLATVAASFVPHPFRAAPPEESAQRIIVAQDARMGELYWGAYAADGAEVLKVLQGDRADPPDAFGERVRRLDFAAHPMVLAGTGVGAYPQLGELLGGDDRCTEVLPSAQDGLALGARDLRNGAGVPPEQALPVYFRAPV